MLDPFQKHLDAALKERSFHKSFEAAKTKQEQIAFCRRFIFENEELQSVKEPDEKSAYGDLSLKVVAPLHSFENDRITWLQCMQTVDAFELHKAPWHEGVKNQVRMNILNKLMEDIVKRGLITWYEEKDFASINVKVAAKLGVVKDGHV